MTGIDLNGVFMGALKLTLLAVMTVYTGLVVVNFRTAGPNIRPRVEWGDPIRSTERVLIWMGTMLLRLAAQMVRPVFGMLSDASADVGEWVLSHRHNELH